MKRIANTLTLLVFPFLLLAQPANDECATLINLGEAPICPIIDTFTNVNATASVISTTPAFNIPSCFNGGAPNTDVWFSFVIPANGSFVDVQIELDAVNGPNGGIVQPQMAIYRGDCSINGLDELACVTSPTGGTSLETLLLGLTPGFEYFIRVEDWSATAADNSGDFVLCVKEPDLEFIMGETPNSTTLCTGALFDSGGATDDYSNDENNTFTICPTDPFACLEVNVSNYNLENNSDFLTFYAGNSVNAPEFVQLTGQGGPTIFGVDSDCLTIQFTSDFSNTASGFELTWECTQNACPSNFITCANPEIIPSLPFDMDGLSTCGTLNSQTFGACPFGLDLLDGEDYIFTYTSLGDECISVIASGVNLNTGVSIYDDCPENSNNCMGAAVSIDGDSAIITSSFLQLPGTYYIVVDNGVACTGFDIYVEQVTCPEALPAAALCDDALSINGCNSGTGSLPSLIQVNQQTTTEPECIQVGVNSGDWGGIGQGYFTWFSFQAQADGDFGFLANNGSIFEDSDIDINVWGPISAQAEVCDFMKNNQPARSTFAADNPDPLAFDFTGLIDINPIDGSPVIDEWEGAGGDGFVSTLPVDSGSWYLVLVNDFSGAIINGGIQMDFASTSTGVLDPNTDNFSISQDMAACPNASVQLEASGGATYDWFPATGLTCTDCPNPISTVTGPMTYEVAIATACSVDTLSVDIQFLEVDAGVDEVICQGELLELGATNTLPGNIDWSWEIPSGSLSCTDCPNPILNTTTFAAGDYDFVVTATNPSCSDSDTLTISVLGVQAPAYDISPDMEICEGDSISIGGSTIAGVNYNWTSSTGIFTSSEANPMVSPNGSVTYYLEVSDGVCPNAILDSVTITSEEIPFLPPLNDADICPGEEVVILNIVTADDISYNWSPTNGIEGSPTLPNNIFTPMETTTYFLSANRGDCIVMDSFTITVPPQPVITLEDVTICTGMETTLTASANLSGTFTWLPSGIAGETFSTGPLTETTTYTVSFIDDNNCPATEEMVTVIVEAGVEITDCTTNPLGAIPLGDEVSLFVETNSTSSLTYDWGTGATTMENNITVTPTEFPQQTYMVTVTDALGCTDSKEFEIEISVPDYEIPNAFTPDGDGVNDIFGAVVNGLNVEIMELIIYNRWGQKVHEGKGLAHHWDGTFEDKDAVSDVYAYFMVIKLPTGEVTQEKGDITLIR